MQKPYRGDYKPDYEKWMKKEGVIEKMSLPIAFCGLYFFCATQLVLGSFFFDLYVDWNEFNFEEHVLTNIYLYIIPIIIMLLGNYQNNDDMMKAREKAENEAEELFQEAMARYEHYWETKYEEAIRQATIDAAVKGINNEELLKIYVRLAEINNQVNEKNFALFNRAKQALESRNSYSIDDTLNQFRQKFLR